MVIDIDEDATAADALPHRSEPFETGGIRRDHTVKFHAAPRLLNHSGRIQEFIFLGNAILVPAGHFLPLVLQGQSQPELRADAVAVGTDVPDHTKRAALANLFNNTLNNLRVAFHRCEPNRLPPKGGGELTGAPAGDCRVPQSGDAEPDFSNSSMMAITRFPRPTESSIWNRSLGVYFNTTARPTSPWMRFRCFANSPSPRFCCSALPRMLIKTTAECRSPVTSTSLTVTRPASLTGNSRRITSPISRFSNSRTRWSLREGIWFWPGL